MKSILLASALVMVVIAGAQAGQTCRTDYLGNVVCTGTGNDFGYSSTTRTDYLGNQTTTDNRGNSQTCRTDYLGNYVCN